MVKFFTEFRNKMLNRNKLAPTATSESDDNTEILARQECVRLSKQLRLLENDRKAYFVESKTAIELQRKVIQSIEKENTEIKEEMKVRIEEGTTQLKENEQEIQGAVLKLRKLEDDCRSEKCSFNEVSRRYEAVKVRLEKLQEVHHKDPFREEYLGLGRLQSKLFQMNRKLETVTAQFDSLVALNGKVRAKIDELLDENVSVSRKLSQLETDLNDKKLRTFELVQEATAAYDQREEASAKMNALSERYMKEKRQFTLEMGELTRVIRNEEKVLNFLSTKNKDRVYLETDEERISRVELAKEQILDQALESYRQNFETLLTKESPRFTSLVDEYAQLHLSNIRQFAQIHELTTEIENLQSDATRLRQEIRQYSAETIQVNLTRKQEIEDKRIELDHLKSEYETVEQEFQKIDFYMGTIVELIEQIFRLTNQTNSVSVLDLVGAQAEINSENTILYASILEQRIKDIISTSLTEKGPLINGMTGISSPFALSPVSLAQGKAMSDIVTSTKNRPKIIISQKASSEHGFTSEDEQVNYDLINTELSPLTYTNMKYKILDAVPVGLSRAGSCRSIVSGCE